MKIPKALTDDGRFAHRPGPAGVPPGAAGRAPPARGSPSKEQVLQSARLARVEQRGHQLLLPLHALSVGQGGGRSHRLDAGHRCYSAACGPTHLQHRFLKEGIQIRQGRAIKGANAAAIEGLPWKRKNTKGKLTIYFVSFVSITILSFLLLISVWM